MRNQNLRKEVRHGLLSGYQHYGCRCDLCKKAKKEYEKQRVLKKVPELVGPKPIKHGTGTAYSYHGCRCEVCCAYHRGYQRYLYLQRKSHENLPDEKLLELLNEINNPCGTAESYSFGCSCNQCLTEGRQLWLKQAVM